MIPEGRPMSARRAKPAKVATSPDGVPASGPARASWHVRRLWREITKPADEIDLAAIVQGLDDVAAALAPAVDQFRAAYARKSRRTRPLFVGMPVGCWHEPGDWRKRTAAGVKRWPKLLAVLDAELVAVATKPRGSVLDAVAIKARHPGMLLKDVAAKAGVTTAAMRASPKFRALERTRMLVAKQARLAVDRAANSGVSQ